jgi:hypothetical protein
MRTVEDWEGDFTDMATARTQQKAKRYPQNLIDMITAGSTVVEGSGESGGADDFSRIGASPTGEILADAPSKGPGKAGGKAAESQEDAGGKGQGLSGFYEKGSSNKANSSTETSGVMVAASRESMADKINDVRSLDRAYTQRLVLLVKDKKDGTWGFPSGIAPAGDKLKFAAEKTLRGALVDDPALDLWYVGNSPVGHLLEVYSPEKQAATGCYGAKVFFYRAEILGGRLRLNESKDYNDIAWLARDECETYLDRPLYKYIHQVIGAGPGEEVARRDAWKARVQGKGLTIAQATGRRNFGVIKSKLAGQRLPAIATSAQAAVSSLKWNDAAKTGQLKEEINSYFARKQVQQQTAAKLSAQLAIPGAASLAAQARATRASKQAVA